MGHEATVSKISEDQLFYLMSRGLTEDEAMAMIVRGFVEPIARELPMEYALELNRSDRTANGRSGGLTVSAPATAPETGAFTEPNRCPRSQRRQGALACRGPRRRRRLTRPPGRLDRPGPARRADRQGRGLAVHPAAPAPRPARRRAVRTERADRRSADRRRRHRRRCGTDAEAAALRGISGYLPTDLLSARIFAEVPSTLLVDVPAEHVGTEPIVITLKGSDADGRRGRAHRDQVRRALARRRGARARGFVDPWARRRDRRR